MNGRGDRGGIEGRSRLAVGAGAVEGLAHHPLLDELGLLALLDHLVLTVHIHGLPRCTADKADGIRKICLFPLPFRFLLASGRMNM